MFDIKFTPRGSKEFKKLSKDWRIRLTEKLKYFASQQEPIKLAKPLTNLLPATHRFRVGDYRIAFFIDEATISYLLGIKKFNQKPSKKSRGIS